MTGVVAFEMIPEAIAEAVCIGKAGGIATAVATTVGGMAVIFAVNKLLDYIERKRGVNDVFRASAMVLAHSNYGTSNDVTKTAIICINAGLSSENKMINTVCGQNRKKIARVNQAVKTDVRRRELIKAGTVMLIAIALHNFPEGMAIGASGTLETHMGVLIAIIIALHNIPEGMAISAPLVSGGVHGGKAILLTALAGGATVLGAVLGLAVGGLGELATGVCLSLASGAMLYVTFCDILPQSITLNDGEVPSISILIGLVFSIIFVFAL